MTRPTYVHVHMRARVCVCVCVCVCTKKKKSERSDEDSSQLEDIYIFRSCLLAAEARYTSSQVSPWENVIQMQTFACVTLTVTIPLCCDLRLPIIFPCTEHTYFWKTSLLFLQNKSNPDTINMTGRISAGSFVLSNIIYLQLLAQETICVVFFLWQGRGSHGSVFENSAPTPGGTMGTYMCTSSIAGQNNLSSVYTNSCQRKQC